MATATVRSPAYVEIATVSVADLQHQTFAGTVTTRNIDKEMMMWDIQDAWVTNANGYNQQQHEDKTNHGYGWRRRHATAGDAWTTDGGR